MTELLYLPEPERAYETTFEARVVDATSDHVELDQTLFYATGGGQPHDTGVLRWDGGEARVVDVRKKGQPYLHKVAGPPPEEDTEVTGEVDWPRRHALMRMHTAQHVLSAVIWDQLEAKTCGNNISKDYSRVDFEVDGFTEAQLAEIEAACNEVFEGDIPLEGYEEDRETLEARIDPRSTLLHLIPKSITRLRVVEIPGVDVCPCAGTHVQRTGEIGRLKVLRTENKGAGRTRLAYELTLPA